MTEAEKTFPVALLRRFIRINDAGDGLVWLPRTLEMHGSARDLKRWNTRYAGQPALTNRSRKGYFVGQIRGRCLLAHRIVWALANGEWPEHFIDHINGCAGDNRIDNLRAATLVENARNQKRHRTNTTGRTGVHFQKSEGKYAAYMRTGNRKRHLGYFTRFEDACAARAAEEKRLGFHPNHGAVR